MALFFGSGRDPGPGYQPAGGPNSPTEPPTGGPTADLYKRITDNERRARKTQRDALAIQAPFTMADVQFMWGGHLDLRNDRDRASFFAVWACLCYEWADAMLAAGEDTA